MAGFAGRAVRAVRRGCPTGRAELKSLHAEAAREVVSGLAYCRRAPASDVCARGLASPSMLARIAGCGAYAGAKSLRRGSGGRAIAFWAVGLNLKFGKRCANAFV